MTPPERELLVSRIIAGVTKVVVPGPRGRDRRFYVRRPTREQLYLAAELYQEVYEESVLKELYSEETLMDFLLAQGFWDEEREKALALLPKQIEESKVALYKATFKSNERAVIRKALALAKAEYARLHAERHAYGYLSCSGAAGIAKARYLVGVSLHHPDGRPVFTDAEFWEDQSPLLDEVMSAVAAARIDEAAFRELARTDPWRTTWNGAKVERSLFGTAPVDWTDDQRALVNWTLLYDNVFQHPEAPGDSVVEDDDLMDGWLILQRRQRDQKLNANDGDQLVKNEKIKGSQEVYLVADTVDDARKVVDLNDEYGRAVQKQRFTKLAQKGTLNELEMPDTAVRLRTEVTAKLSQAMNARKG